MSESDLRDLPAYLRREIQEMRDDIFDMNWERY